MNKYPEGLCSAKYIEAEKKLAGLLGWTDILIKEEGIFQGVFGCPPNYKEFGMSEGQRCSMPNWVMDNAAAFALMVEYSVFPFAVNYEGGLDICVEINDHMNAIEVNVEDHTMTDTTQALEPIDLKFLADNLPLLANKTETAIAAFSEEWAAGLARDALRLLGEYSEVLRGLAFSLSAGGYNSEGLIDPKTADEKIRWGINHICEVERKRAAPQMPGHAQEASNAIASAESTVEGFLFDAIAAWNKRAAPQPIDILSQAPLEMVDRSKEG